MIFPLAIKNLILKHSFIHKYVCLFDETFKGPNITINDNNKTATLSIDTAELIRCKYPIPDFAVTVVEFQFDNKFYSKYLYVKHNIF